MLLILLLILAGLLGGILAGLLGIGGGVIYILILPYALEHLGIPQEYLVQFTIANSISGIFFASCIANILNIRNRDFYPRESILVAFTGALISLLVLKLVVNTPFYTAEFFNLLLVVFLTYMLISSAVRFKETGKNEVQVRDPARLGITGGLGGALSALTGLGGGAVIVPMLNTWMNMDIKKARAISLIMIFLTSMTITIFNLFERIPNYHINGSYGFIFTPVMVPLAAGVISGSPVGVWISRKLSSKIISVIFAVFLLIVLIEKLIRLLNAF